MGWKLTEIVIAGCALALLILAEDPNISIEDDTVIIEVPDENSRVKRDLIFSDGIPQPIQVKAIGGRLHTIGPCFTSKGSLGQCTSFRKCYPYFKLPELGNWETWILGMYDTCSFFTEQGRQMFGVCCTNPLAFEQPIEKPTTTTAPIVDEADKSEQMMQENENKHIPVTQNEHSTLIWPPQIPTHPPDHTIPPLPTHPPDLHAPTHSTPANHPSHPTHPHPTQPHPTHPPHPIHVYPTHPTTMPTTSKPTTTLAPSHPISASCGAKNGYQDQERIVGGHNADLGEWPWIAALFNAGRQFCGGSLINNVHILSAAHCVAHMSSWDVARLTVRLGDYNIKVNTEVRHVEKKVKRVVRHRGFDSRTLYNDIAILTLDSPVTFSQQIRPICLPSGSQLYMGQTATVIGWGSLRESGPQPQILQEVNIPIWSNTECRAKYGSAAPGGIVEHMLCAGQAGRDSCSGDSGGPLMVNNGKWTQVGIVSWGIGCGKGQYPGVYTRVTHFLPWINKNLK